MKNKVKIIGPEGKQITSVECPKCGEWFNKDFMVPHETGEGDKVLYCLRCSEYESN